MSSGQQSCNDAEDDWDAFKAARGLNAVLWRVYSTEAQVAKELVRKDNTLIGMLLKLDTMHEVQKRALNLTQTRERAELVKALAVLEKLA